MIIFNVDNVKQVLRYVNIVSEICVVVALNDDDDDDCRCYDNRQLNCSAVLVMKPATQL